ncbi:MAG: J domain-containing protein [Limisphaerales bacterium]
MSRPAPNHYETLGVADGASPEHLKRVYLALVKRWHPDRFADDPAQQKLAEEKLRTINVAYEALTGEAQVKQSFQHGATAPEYNPADAANKDGRAAYTFRERPSGFAVWRGHTGWLSWAGSLTLILIAVASFWFVAESLAYHYGPPYAADFIRHEAKLQSVYARTRRAADAGEAWAMVNMGWFHYRGRAVGVNKVEAAQWCARAALAGDPGAQLQLGVMLVTDDGMPADATLARQWWERAAAGGNAEARRRLDGLKQ